MKAYPEVRAARPRKWFWLVNVIPCIHVYAHVTFVGFWRSTTTRKWHPRQKGWRLRINHNGAWWRQNTWDIPKLQVERAI